LNRKGREDELEVASVVKIPGTEEGGTEPPVRGDPFRHRLRNRGLSRPGEPVQPTDGRLVEVEGPEFDLVQYDPASSLQTAVSVPVSILGLFPVMEIVKDSCIGYRGVNIVRNNIKQLIF
jgi:hypothetical protein